MGGSEAHFWRDRLVRARVCLGGGGGRRRRCGLTHRLGSHMRRRHRHGLRELRLGHRRRVEQVAGLARVVRLLRMELAQVVAYRAVMHAVVVAPAAVVGLDAQVHAQVHLQIGLARAHLAALDTNPFGLVEVNRVHVVFEIRAVGERLLAQRTLGHKLEAERALVVTVLVVVVVIYRRYCCCRCEFVVISCGGVSRRANLIVVIGHSALMQIVLHASSFGTFIVGLHRRCTQTHTHTHSHHTHTRSLAYLPFWTIRRICDIFF